MAFVPRVFAASFKARLTLGTILINILVAGFAAYTVYTSFTDYERRSVVSTQNLAQLLAQDLAASFARMDMAVLAVKEEIESKSGARNWDRDQMRQFIERQMSRQQHLAGLRVANAEGLLTAGSDVTEGDPVSVAWRDFFRALKNSTQQQLLISKPVMGQLTGKWSIVLARRINAPDGSFGGVVYGYVFVEDFQRTFASIDLGPHGAVSLRDLELGTVARHPEPAPTGTSVGNRTFSKEWVEKLKENPNFGSYFAVGLDGLKRALSYRRVADYPFFVVVGQDPSDYLAEWDQQVLNTTLLVCVFSLVTCWLAKRLSDAWERQQAESLLRADDHERMLLELHDGAIQSIYAVGLHLENAKQLVTSAPQEATTGLSDAIANLNLVIQDLRAFISGERSSAYTESKFMQEIERMLPPVTEEGLQFSINIDRSIIESLKPDQAKHLLRIARESISNIVRHSNASSAYMSLQRKGETLHLEVGDDGVGIDRQKRRNRNGLGLHHISARAHKLGGQVHYQSAANGGTQMTVEFPLAA